MKFSNRKVLKVIDFFQRGERYQKGHLNQKLTINREKHQRTDRPKDKQQYTQFSSKTLNMQINFIMISKILTLSEAIYPKQTN